MLNPFPDLLTYALAAPFILRLVLGYCFLNFGYGKLISERAQKIRLFEKIGLRPGTLYNTIIGTLEIVAGLTFVVGFYTQIAALISILILLGVILIKRKNPDVVKGTISFFIVLLAIALSLLFSGAGFWAFDLPL